MGGQWGTQCRKMATAPARSGPIHLSISSPATIANRKEGPYHTSAQQSPQPYGQILQ